MVMTEAWAVSATFETAGSSWIGGSSSSCQTVIREVEGFRRFFALEESRPVGREADQQAKDHCPENT